MDVGARKASGTIDFSYLLLESQPVLCSPVKIFPQLKLRETPEFPAALSCGNLPIQVNTSFKLKNSYQTSFS